MVTVSIRDDMLVENQFERFFINLRNYWYESAVILSRPTTSVSIEDNNDSEFSLQYKDLNVYQNVNCSQLLFHLSGYNWIQWNIFSA